jgi:hypothetical protein
MVAQTHEIEELMKEHNRRLLEQAQAKLQPQRAKASKRAKQSESKTGPTTRAMTTAASRQRGAVASGRQNVTGRRAAAVSSSAASSNIEASRTRQAPAVLQPTVSNRPVEKVSIPTSAMNFTAAAKPSKPVASVAAPTRRAAAATGKDKENAVKPPPAVTKSAAVSAPSKPVQPANHVAKASATLELDPDIAALLAQHNKQFRPKADYVPRTHSVHEIRKVAFCVCVQLHPLTH